jgi:competence protein ComEC
MVVSGRVREVDPLPVGRRVTIEAPSLDGGPALRRAIRVRLKDSDPVALAAGDIMRVRALLRPPPAPAYPGGWDLQRDAYFTGLAAYGFAIGPATLLHAAPASSLQRLRETVAARVALALPGPRGAIAAAMLAGSGTSIPAADRAAFQASGLSHLLAVAGLHVGIVMGLALALCRIALAAYQYTALHWPTRRIAAIASLLTGGGYLLLTGGHVPILRSFAMACLVTLAVVAGRRAISLRALALAAACIIVLAPYDVMGVSFQMSFAAVMALAAAWEAVQPSLLRRGSSRYRRWMGYALGLGFTSAVAGTATLPFAAYHFGTITPWYVPANMVAVPLTALWVMPWGLAALPLMPFHLEALALVPMGWGIDGLIWIAHAVAAWPGAIVALPQMPPASLLMLAIALAWLCLWRSAVRALAVLPALAAVVCMMVSRPPDAMLSADGHGFAARLGRDVVAQDWPGLGRFDRDAAQRIWAQIPVPLPASGSGGHPGLLCGADACTLQWPAGRAVLARTEPGCQAGMETVISPLYLAGACSAAVLVDRAYVAMHGATAISIIAHGTIVLTDRMVRGDRPWVLAGKPLLPMAQVE